VQRRLRQTQARFRSFFENFVRFIKDFDRFIEGFVWFLKSFLQISTSLATAMAVRHARGRLAASWCLRARFHSVFEETE
jgi:hypothetical protein